MRSFVLTMTTTIFIGDTKLCKFVCIVVLTCLISGTICQDQTQQPQNEQQQQQHHEPHHHATQATRTPLGTRWNRRQQIYPTAAATTTPACDYKELLSNLHDRVAILASLDEDQRNRLESISKKIVQFETSNLARLDSLGVQQMDISKRLDTMELVQRMTKRELEQLVSEFASKTFANKKTQLNEKVNEKDEENKSSEVNNDLSSQRQIREVLQSGNSQILSDTQKLDALSTLLVSTRSALQTLQTSLETNMMRVFQETNKLNRRIANVQRRQLQHFQNQQPYQIYGHLPGPGATLPTHTELITSCALGLPTSHGILRLQLTEKSEPFYVRCDEEYMNGGWTIIQNRYTGDLNFQRDWQEYKTGFGNLASEFFIGLDKLHELTSNAVQELVIVLEDFAGVQHHAKYDLFAIGNEAESYALKLLGDYEGTAGDSLSYHAGSKFSTFDNDNDGCVECNCAQAHFGAWWYNWCEQSNLNGKYYKENETVARYTGMYWHGFHGPNVSLKAARMMIRPVAVDQENRR